MKSTNAERMNLFIREWLRPESCGGVVKFRARWQAAPETMSGHALRNLLLELAPSVSEPLMRLNA